MADVSPRRVDSRPAAANAAATATATATLTAPTWDFLTVHTRRALKRRHSERDEHDEREGRDDSWDASEQDTRDAWDAWDARRSTNGDDPSRLMSLMLANSSSAHSARPSSSAHPAHPRANDAAVATANPSPRPLSGLAEPVTPPSAFPPSVKPAAFAGLGSHGHGLAPICATPASVSASHADSLHASPAAFPPPPLSALFTLRQASIPRGALLPLPELLLPGLPRGGPGAASLPEALFRRLLDWVDRGSSSSSGGELPSSGVRPELPSPARYLKRCKVVAADVGDADAAAAAASADAAASATAQQKTSERPSAKGSTPAKASSPTPPVTPSNEEAAPASWPKAGPALEPSRPALEPSGPADKGLLTQGAAVLCEGHADAVESGGEMASPRGEHGDVGMVGEQAMGESGGACEEQMREQLKQAIKERLAQAQLLQARLLQARLVHTQVLQTRQVLHSDGEGEHTSCSTAAGVAPRSPPALVLQATQNKCSQGEGAPTSFSPAAVTTCSPAAVTACSPAPVAACSPTALSTTAGPVCAADLNLPPADVAGAMESEAVVVESEDADLALAAMAIECEAREAREAGKAREARDAGGLPASDECMAETDTPCTAPGCSAQGDFPGTACPAGRDASADAPGNAPGIARDAVFLFACNLGAEKVSGANDVFAANSSKLDGADSRAGCLDLTLRL
ncbi:unnamed protein product [Closterium sp. Naga37s-1]|nr:unnamed protein product [Closterium sp. Naga37s-1]